MSRKQLIIDCDAGTDDAVALIILLAAHKQERINIKAISCVHGNTSVENVVKNVFRTLQACAVYDVPVFQGSDSPLLSIEKTYDDYHGSDGFGDVYKDEVDISNLQKEHAIFALNRIVSEEPGNVTVVCLGPLTNVAIASKVYPEFLNNVKEFFVMGGNSTARGNVTAQAEFNFWVDPESVHIVLKNNTKPLFLLPWETCLKSQVSHEWRDEILGQIDTPCIKLINDIERGASRSRKVQFPFYKPCDAFLAAIILRPDMAKSIVSYHADIELNGTKTRGQVVLDHLLSTKPNVSLIQDFDTEIFQELLLSAAKPSDKSDLLS